MAVHRSLLGRHPSTLGIGDDFGRPDRALPDHPSPMTCCYVFWRRCCANRNWPARCQPTELSPADAIRHWPAEVGHPIQDLAAEDDLTSLPG